MPHSVRVILKKALHKGAITSADYEKVMRNVIQVRCKDCKHKYVPDDMEDKWCYWVDTDEDDFCSYGERRDDAEIQ